MLCFALPSICKQTRCVLFHGCVCSFRRRYLPIRYAPIRSILEYTQLINWIWFGGTCYCLIYAHSKYWQYAAFRLVIYGIHNFVLLLSCCQAMYLLYSAMHRAAAFDKRVGGDGVTHQRCHCKWYSSRRSSHPEMHCRTAATIVGISEGGGFSPVSPLLRTPLVSDRHQLL